jgi:hypothetical protein
VDESQNMQHKSTENLLVIRPRKEEKKKSLVLVGMPSLNVTRLQ